MTFNSKNHHRRSIRLQKYDYSQPGYYFITVCVYDRKQNLFGDIINAKMELNEFGKIVQNEIFRTAQIRPNIKIDEYMVMPNHVHININICGESQNVGGTLQNVGDAFQRRGTLQRAPTNTPVTPNTCIPPNTAGTLQRAPTNLPHTPQIEQFGKPTSNSIPTIVRLFKSTVTKQINILRNMPGIPVWQRNYYERIAWDEKALFYISKYIHENPIHWHNDSENHIEKEIKILDLEEKK
jgi:putative transposase